jgi:hypothetical protein
MVNTPYGFQTMSDGISGAANYYAWIYSYLSRYLGDHIVEIGPGYGSFALQAIKHKKSYYAIDLSKEIIDRLKHTLKLPEDCYFVGDVTREDVRAVGLGLAALGMSEAAAVWRLLAAHPEREDSAPEDVSEAGARVLRLCSDAHDVMHGLASAGWDDHPGRCAALLLEKVRP